MARLGKKPGQHLGLAASRSGEGTRYKDAPDRTEIKWARCMYRRESARKAGEDTSRSHGVLWAGTQAMMERASERYLERTTFVLDVKKHTASVAKSTESGTGGVARSNLMLPIQRLKYADATQRVHRAHRPP